MYLIYWPRSRRSTAAVEEMERDLPATGDQFSLSLSLFILVQGVIPLVWSAISEIKGRKVRCGLAFLLFS